MDATARLIDEYRKWAVMRGESDDVRKANYAFDKLMHVRRRLFDAGPDQAQEIMTLLDDANIHVRYAAAFDTLSLDPDVALPVLRELARGPKGPTRLDAEETIEFWEAGKLELPDWKRQDWNRTPRSEPD